MTCLKVWNPFFSVVAFLDFIYFILSTCKALKKATSLNIVVMRKRKFQVIQKKSIYLWKNDGCLTSMKRVKVKKYKHISKIVFFWLKDNRSNHMLAMINNWVILIYIFFTLFFYCFHFSCIFNLIVVVSQHTILVLRS